MTALTVKVLPEREIVDAYIAQASPTTAFGTTDPNTLYFGGTSPSKRYVWIGFPAGVSFIPEGSSIFRALLLATIRIPKTAPFGASAPTIKVLRATSSYSAANVTYNEVLSEETASDNWPLEQLSSQKLNLPDALSDPDWPSTSPLKTHGTRQLSLDVTAWWNKVEDQVVGYAHRGFFLSTDDVGTSFIAMSPADTPAQFTPGIMIPMIELVYGYPVKDLTTVEQTSYGAKAFWEEAPGADFYLVEYSADAGNTWSGIPFVTTTSAQLDNLAPDTLYYVRVTSGYKDFGLCGPASNSTAFVTASLSTPNESLTKPAAPTITVSSTRQQVTITLPSSFVENPSIDTWQVARRQGPVGSTLYLTDPTVTDIVALVPANVTEWIDRFPGARRQGYQIRGRVDSARDIWTPWSKEATAYDTVGDPLRSRLDAPNSTLELGLSRLYVGGPILAAHVETSAGTRHKADGGEVLELNVVWRADLAATTTESFRIGLRYYDRNGFHLSDFYVDKLLELTNGEPPGGVTKLTAIVPGSASRYGLFFEIVQGGGDVRTRVRIERIDLYRKNADKNTGWEYIQVPDPSGTTADDRNPLLDQSVFSYDGIGWAPLAAPPSGAASTGPYRETITPDDEITFISTGQYHDLLFYAATADTVVEVARLSDSVVVSASQEDGSWRPIVDDSMGTMVLSGTELMMNPGAEVNTTDWLTHADAAIDEPTAGNGTLSRTITAPISGVASFQIAATALKGGAYWLSPSSVIFKAGRTYKVQMSVQETAATAAWELFFGYRGAIFLSGRWQFAIDAEVKSFTATTGISIVTVYWTPRVDYTDQVHVAVRSAQAAATTLKFDLVSVQEVVGVRIPAAADYTLHTITLPPWFSAFHPTAYKVKLVSGRLRPLGLRRDPINIIDQVFDFSTVLRALGNIRNSTLGELEFRADLSPPRVYHWAYRGIDHSQIPGGLDLRRGKNVTVSKRTKDSSQVVNRLIVQGYGDDRTQLVYELRSSIDRLGRVPSDPFYRHDAQGRSPSHPDWDSTSGGISEEVFGIRYGRAIDASITSIYQAQQVGTQLVERAAWPHTTYEVSALDLGDIPALTNVGDLITIRYGHEDIRERIVEMTTDIASPRALTVVLGEDPQSAASKVERLTKDVETTISSLNSATGAAG